MIRSMAALPAVEFTEEEIFSGQLPHIEARLAAEVGPIFRRRILAGPYAGLEMVMMVGPEANRFVLHTHREHFSHDRGWTPIIGEMMGRGWLNMDGAEHDRHR